MIWKKTVGVRNLSPLGYFFPALHRTPKPQHPVGKGCLYSGPGRIDVFPCAQRARFNQLSAEESGLCWACRWDPALGWADTELFQIFVVFYLFLVQWALPDACGDLQASPSATSAIGNVHQENCQERHSSAPRWECFHVSAFDDSRFFQTKVLLHHRRHDVLCYAVSLCRIYFSNQGIAKPRCVAT